MILTNIDSIPGYDIIEHYGLVSGNTVRSRHAGIDFAAGFKKIIGGELKGYSELMQDSRKEAIQRMQEEAGMLGANAIINVRFVTSSIGSHSAEIYAYGTAVKVTKK